jgi:5'-3' exonuclease
MILLIDSNYLAYRTSFTMGDLSYHERKTGVIFGFLNQILWLSKQFKTDSFLFCFDSRKNIRRRIYPSYKENRSQINPDMKRLKDVMFPQVDLLRREILPQMGFKNVFMWSGYESDDTIARLVYLFRQEKFVVVSSDSDLYQLLDHCDIYDLSKKEIKNKKWFEDEYGITPKKWKYVKAIAGCESDNVKGIVGVGEKTAIKYIKGGGGMREDLYKKIVSKEGQEIIKRNLRLVSLPYKGFNPGIINLHFGKGNLDNFLDICQKYDLRSFTNSNKLDDWKNLLNGGD